MHRMWDTHRTILVDIYVHNTLYVSLSQTYEIKTLILRWWYGHRRCHAYMRNKPIRRTCGQLIAISIYVHCVFRSCIYAVRCPVAFRTHIVRSIFVSPVTCPWNDSPVVVNQYQSFPLPSSFLYRFESNDQYRFLRVSYVLPCTKTWLLMLDGYLVDEFFFTNGGFRLSKRFLVLNNCDFYCSKTKKHTKTRSVSTNRNWFRDNTSISCSLNCVCTNSRSIGSKHINIVIVSVSFVIERKRALSFGLFCPPDYRSHDAERICQNLLRPRCSVYLLPIMYFVMDYPALHPPPPTSTSI